LKVITFGLDYSNKIIKKKISRKICKSYVVRTHLGKEYIVFVLILTLKEELKNAVNVINGMSKVMTGQVMKTLDNKIQRFTKIRHDLKIIIFQYFKKHVI